MVKPKKTKPTKSRLAPIGAKVSNIILRPVRLVRHKIKDLQSRRPHRSFKRTRRRDYNRSLKLPNYWLFTLQVVGTLRKRTKLFLALAIVYTILMVVLGGMTSQETYTKIGDLINDGADGITQGNWGKIGQAGLLGAAAFAGGSGNLSDVQQIYLGLIILLTWLTTVWLLREQLAGRKPKLRDGIYNASSPLLSTLLVVLYMLIQMLPLGIVAIAYAALSGVGLLEEGFSWLLFSSIAGLVISLTLYWLTSTFIALVVVTLPGMYPSRALRAAGDLVVGRRLRIILRLIWMIVMAALVWFIIMIPLILFDSWIRGKIDIAWLEFIPLVPLVATLLSSLTAIWAASYIYILYRKIVDDDSAPA